jgi:UDP-N-acetylmuramate dehydrogenase
LKTPGLPRFIREREPLWRHTTFKIGGPADYYAPVSRLEELIEALSWARAARQPCFVMGWGSNILVQDGGIRGLVLRLKGEFETVEWTGARASAGGGVHLPKFAKMCLNHSLSGAEPLVGVPGTVGGALMSNAGTPRGEIGPLVEEVELIDWNGRRRHLKKRDLEFGYRSSNLVNRGVVARARLCLKPDGKNVIMRKIQSELEVRTQTQPVGTHNVGSVFQNPPNDFAGRLIETVGLKGHRAGGAQFSPKHGNFIVNVGHATSKDVLFLIALARTKVRERFGLELPLEIKVVGEPA